MVIFAWGTTISAMSGCARLPWIRQVNQQTGIHQTAPSDTHLEGLLG